MDLGQDQFAQTRPRTGGQQPDIVRHLDQTDRDGAQRSGSRDRSIERGLRLEMILTLANRDPGPGADRGADTRGELGVSVETGADRGTP